MKEFVEKLIKRLEELRKIEYDREDYADKNDSYSDWEEAFTDGESNGKYYAYTKAIKIVNRLTEEHKPGWIPCDERLPDEETTVIMTTKAGNVMVGLYTKKYGFEMKEGFICSDCFMYLRTVLAWMPLPEPYGLEE